MSTDNGKILKGNSNRSLFGLHLPYRTTHNLGQINVHNIQFALPKTTIKKRGGVYYEMKATVGKISSQLKANSNSFAVPLSAIWKYYPEFISKGAEFIQNGGFNTPYVQTNEGTSIKTLPTFKVAKLFGYFLAGAGSGSFPNPNRMLIHAQPNNANTANPENYDGNRQAWTFDNLRDGSFGEAGSYVRNPLTVTSAGNVPLWWTPRLLGNGFSQTGINHPTTRIGSGSSSIWVNSFRFTDPRILHLLNTYFKPFANAPTSYKTLTITQCYDKTGGYVYYYVLADDNADGIYSTILPSVPTSSWASSTTFPWAFRVSTKTTGSSRHYGDIEFNISDVNTSMYRNASGQDGRFNIAGSQSGDNAGKWSQFAFNLACIALFDNARLFGVGSLLEQMGVHLFESVDVTASIYESMFSSLELLGAQSVLTAPVRQLNASIFNEIYTKNYRTTICTLPFYAYQKCVSDRYLLPHEVLSNNSGMTSTVDASIRYDSPYFRNNMVPTMCYYHNYSGLETEDEDDFYLYSDDASTPKWHFNVNGTSTDGCDPSLWHYIRSINEFCTIFLERNAMISLDMFTRIWQKENHNVQNILDASDFRVSKDDGTGSNVFNALGALLTKKFMHFISKGNTDMDASRVIENHFGVNDVPCERHQVVMLSSDVKTLQTEDVINSGGAVDADGSPLPLGDKSTVMSLSFPVKNEYSCFVPDFSFILDMSHISAEVNRVKAPLFPTYNLGKFAKIREDFQIMFFPEFQATGDEVQSLDKIEFGGDANVKLGFTNKNNAMKDGYSRIDSEWIDKYRNQLICSYLPTRFQLYAPALTYGYLQPNSLEYNFPIAEKYGQHLLVTYDDYVYLKSPLSKRNEVCAG